MTPHSPPEAQVPQGDLRCGGARLAWAGRPLRAPPRAAFDAAAQTPGNQPRAARTLRRAGERESGARGGRALPSRRAPRGRAASALSAGGSALAHLFQI